MNNDLISRSAMLDDLRGSYNDLKNIYDKLHYPDEKEICKAELATFMEVILRVKDAHAVDAVEVVRCKDCKFYNNHGMRDVVFDHDACHWNADEQPDPDDFCSAGERRADDATD